MYDKILITDISVNEEVAKQIEEQNDQKDFFVLLDHHKTAEWLNKYDWANVHSHHHILTEHLSSGTSMLIWYIQEKLEQEVKRSLLYFAEQVRRYDTWEWQTFYEDDLPGRFNNLLKIKRRDDFIASMLTLINDNQEIFPFASEDQMLLDYYEGEVKSYISQKLDKVREINIGDHLVGIVFAENHISELGNKMCEKYGHLDYAVIINPTYDKISFRTIHDDLDLGQIAQKYGGGGHPKAAGGYLPDFLMNDFLAGFIARGEQS